jgi:hypothetical protein
VRELSRRQLTVATADRQLLIERARLTPARAVRLLTPLQAQHPPAPYVALAARLEGFERARLEAAVGARTVMKTTIMRLTLHLVSGGDYPAYAQLCRHSRLRQMRSKYPEVDLERVTWDLSAWLREPRSNVEIRDRVRSHGGVPDEPWAPVLLARVLVPLVQLPPGGHWSDRGRASFVLDPRPLPDPDDAAALVLRRYLGAFGPASRRDATAWAGVAQRDLAGAWERVRTVSYADEHGTELLDLLRRALPPESTRLPVRFLARWDQPLLAYARRERVMPPEVQALKLTLSGDPTVTVEGRVAASWRVERAGDTARLEVTPHLELSRDQRAEIRAEGERTAWFCAPDAARIEISGV